MKKQKNLVLKLSLLTISIFVLLFGIYSVVSTVLVYRNSLKQSEENIQAVSESATKEIQQIFEETISVLRTESDVVSSLHAQNQLTPNHIMQLQQQVLNTNENFLGVSIILDAANVQEIDENDIDIRNNSNLYAHYTYRENGKITTMHLEDVAQADWFTVPKDKQLPYVTEPFDYDLNGKTVSMVTVTMPILINNQFFGVALADFTLDFLDEIIARNVPATAIQRVISPGGIVLSDSSNEENKKQQITNFVADWDSHSKKIQSGETVTFYANDGALNNKEAFSLFTPLKIDQNEKNWIVQTLIPKSTILATYNSIVKITILAAILMSVILAALTYLFISRNLKPLQNVKFALEEAAAGKLTVEVDKSRLNNDEIGSVAFAFNHMREQMHTVVGNVSSASDLILEKSVQMNRSMEEMSQSSEEIAKAIEEIAKGAQVQSAEIDQSNSQMSSLGDKIDELSEISNEMLESIHESSNQAHRGMEEVHNLRQQTNEVSTVNEDLDLQMNTLGERIQNINKVMESIQTITAQTNLLALNASIEAARAGEHGKGFAVVAEEVRKLAEQSQRETEEVQHTVTSILQQAEQTSRIVQKSRTLMTLQRESVTSTETAFKEQLTHASHIEQRINQFIERLRAMLDEKENTVLGMQQIVAISEQSAASAEEVTASAAEQHNEIEKIVDMMNELRDLANDLKVATEKFIL
ncbi:methyl-accepting chemotaxis sensory transducer with Cache sensor [Ureibacillus xyleni]|uniref:Methyl-accepting chemotaxis sensory transducer with Cache sensor n=1 Tax=Ureibacillus xyleni TaxID=614648 RepID=A0A285TCX6_9BACL|nr:methyl-accepting chemotaxis protein [Ureibacillus xyleni]SOC19897.1 methyl-accepting chemotaxis sensory transducer with Cache sensor [Ureibacillus xyleni]